MLALRFVKQVGVDIGFAGGRLEDLFLDRRGKRQHHADRLGQRAALVVASLGFSQLLVLLEQRIDLLVVSGQ